VRTQPPRVLALEIGQEPVKRALAGVQRCALAFDHVAPAFRQPARRQSARRGVWRAGCWANLLYIRRLAAGASCSLRPNLRKQMMLTSRRLLEFHAELKASWQATARIIAIDVQHRRFNYLDTSVQYSVESAVATFQESRSVVDHQTATRGIAGFSERKRFP
jgi:hypothetical protein